MDHDVLVSNSACFKRSQRRPALENPREIRQLTSRVDPDGLPTEDRQPQVVYVSAPVSRRDWLDVALRLLAALAMGLVIALLAALLLIIVGLTGTLNAANTSLSGAARAIQDAGAALQQPAEGLLDRLQPDRPPPAAVSQGVEFVELRRVAVGDLVGETGGYLFTLGRVVKREGATDPNQAQYAVVHRKLQVPNKRTVGPVVVGEDWDEADYYLYKGQSFRLGSRFYQVNWVSLQDNAAGIARYRDPDRVTDPMKFQSD